MKLIEIFPLLNSYIASVRVVIHDSSITVRTMIDADNIFQARSMLSRIYGERNVLSVRECPRSKQIQRCATSNEESAEKLNSAPSQRLIHDSQVLETPTTPGLLSPEEQRVKAMSDQAKRLKQQAKQIKAQQQLKSAQAQLNAATKP